MKKLTYLVILFSSHFLSYGQQLEVEGDMQISDPTPSLYFHDNGVGEERTEFQIRENDNRIFLESLYGPLNLGASLQGQTNVGLTIWTNRDIGIGTTFPVVKLHIKDDFELFRLEGTSHAFLTFYRGQAKYGEIGFTTVNTKKLTIRNSNQGLNDVIQLLGGNSGSLTLYPDGKLYANNLGNIGDHKNMQYDDATGEIGWDNSSRRYKTNIQTLADNWSKMLQTRPVKYTRPQSPDHWEYGYIAEEIDSIGLTNLVGYDKHGLPDDVKYDRMVIYLTEIVKDQQKRIDDLEEKFSAFSAQK